eukprot:scaffold15966_cov52-Attheya_sp.AAC.1
MTPWFGSFLRKPSPPPLEEEDPEEGQLSGTAHEDSIGTNNHGEHLTTAAAAIMTIMVQEQHGGDDEREPGLPFR